MRCEVILLRPEHLGSDHLYPELPSRAYASRAQTQHALGRAFIQVMMPVSFSPTMALQQSRLAQVPVSLIVWALVRRPGCSPSLLLPLPEPEGNCSFPPHVHSAWLFLPFPFETVKDRKVQKEHTWRSCTPFLQFPLLVTSCQTCHTEEVDTGTVHRP